MRIGRRFLVVMMLAASTVAAPVHAQDQLAQLPQFLSAKTIYLKNQTGSDTVGANAVAELKKWKRFHVVENQKQADLVLLLSLEPYKGPDSASDNDGDLDKGDFGRTPHWNQQKPMRYAYLTVIDPKSGMGLWTAEHIWGGLLTGFNSAGERLVKELEKQTKN
jgi:hypothetical protein